MSEAHTLQGSKELRFRGDAIGEASAWFDMTDWDERHLNLRLFTNDQGGFVAAIDFSSMNFSIEKACEAEQMDTLEDVEKFYLVFDPLDHVAVSRTKNMSSPSDHARQQLQDLYLSLVDDLMAKARVYHDRHPGCERVVTESKKEVNRVLKFFGLV